MARNKIFWGIGFWVLAVAGMLAPMGVWFFLNRAEYFTPSQSSDLAMGLIIGLVFCLALIAGAFKQIDKRFSTVIMLGVLLGIVYFLEPIINDLFFIILAALVGYIIFMVFSSLGNRALKFHSAYSDEKMRVEARTEAESLAIHL